MTDIPEMSTIELCAQRRRLKRHSGALRGPMCFPSASEKVNWLAWWWSQLMTYGKQTSMFSSSICIWKKEPLGEIESLGTKVKTKIINFTIHNTTQSSQCIVSGPLLAINSLNTSAFVLDYLVPYLCTIYLPYFEYHFVLHVKVSSTKKTASWHSRATASSI
jgi:hypothetical protein